MTGGFVPLRDVGADSGAPEPRVRAALAGPGCRRPATIPPRRLGSSSGRRHVLAFAGPWPRRPTTVRTRPQNPTRVRRYALAVARRARTLPLRALL